MTYKSHIICHTFFVVFTQIAYAKINLGLAVLGKRDDGFHNIDTVMVRLNVKDEITINVNDVDKSDSASNDSNNIASNNGSNSKGRLELSLKGEYANQLTTNQDNLVYRAAQSYLQHAGIESNVEIVLQKSIPIAAGLGGGSADAAATLQALAIAFPLGIDLFSLAMQLGSDVGFFILQLAAARAQGRGERLIPVYLTKLHVVLVKPEIAVTAKEAYETIPEDHAYGKAGTTEIIDHIITRLQRHILPNKLPNHLEPGICAAYPEVANVLDILRDITDLEGVSMTGSGSTCFGLAQSAQHARDVASNLKRFYPQWWVRAVHTI